VRSLVYHVLVGAKFTIRMRENPSQRPGEMFFGGPDSLN
jgi:hypothetical protein